MNTQHNDPKGAAGAAKTPLGLIPPHAMEQTALVHQLGATKYGAFNWRDSGICASTYVNAILRHLNAWRDGETLDPESGISHLAHIACSCNILLDADHCDMLHDDRNIIPQNIGCKHEGDLDDSFYVDFEKYIDLDKLDTIQDGDEYYDPYKCKWEKSVMAGSEILDSDLFYRRPINNPDNCPKTAKGTECKCGRILINHWTLGMICEDCDLQWQDPY